MSRPTNRELVDAVRHELAAGFAAEHDAALVAATHDWRRRVWALVREIDRRMCPLDHPEEVRR